jgi:hypothetical protein
MNNVQFTSSSNQEPTKPPRPATLNLPLNNNFTLNGGNNNSGPNSNRQPTQRSQNTANNVINFGTTSAPKAAVNKSAGASPIVSSRGPPTPSFLAQKKASDSRQAEIDMVRQLNW